MLERIAIGQATPQQAACEWLTQNEKIWRKWVSIDTNGMANPQTDFPYLYIIWDMGEKYPNGTLYFVLVVLGISSFWLMLPLTGVAWVDVHFPAPWVWSLHSPAETDLDNAQLLRVDTPARQDMFRSPKPGNEPVEGAIAFAAMKFYCYEEEPHVEARSNRVVSVLSQ